MDAVFGFGNAIKISDAWKWLCEYDDRFTKSLTIKGSGDIVGLRREDAVKTIEYLAAQNNIYEGEEKIVGYWDIEEEKIWVLSPVKMALLLKLYDEAEKLLNKGYLLEAEQQGMQDCVIMAIDAARHDFIYRGLEIPPELGNSDSFKTVKMWCTTEYVSGMALLCADENVPENLAIRILNSCMEESGACFYDALYQNKINEQINPKWLIRLYEISDNKKYFYGLGAYAFSRAQAFMADINDDWGLATIISWSQHMYCYKVRLQLQMDLAKIMVESKNYTNLKRAILRDTILASTFEIRRESMTFFNVNKKYAIEQIKCLMKQRNKLIELCKDNKSLFRTAVLKSWSEIVSLKNQLIENNYYAEYERNLGTMNKKYRDIAYVIDQYEKTVTSYFSPMWKDKEIQVGIQPILNELCSLEGMTFVNDIAQCMNRKLVFTANDEIMKALNKWLVFLYVYAESIENMAKNEDFLSDISEQEKTQINLHNYIGDFSKYLEKTEWIVNESWITKEKSIELDKLINGICRVDDDLIYRTMYKVGILTDSILEKTIDKLLTTDSYENVPYLIALRG